MKHSLPCKWRCQRRAAAETGKPALRHRSHVFFHVQSMRKVCAVHHNLQLEFRWVEGGRIIALIDAVQSQKVGNRWTDSATGMVKGAGMSPEHALQCRSIAIITGDNWSCTAAGQQNENQILKPSEALKGLSRPRSRTQEHRNRLAASTAHIKIVWRPSLMKIQMFDVQQAC